MGHRETYDAAARQVRHWWISPGRVESYTARFKGTFEQALARAAGSSAFWKSSVHVHTDLSGEPVGPRGEPAAPIDYFGPLWATVTVPGSSPLRGGPLARPLLGTYANRPTAYVTTHNAAARALFRRMMLRGSRRPVRRSPSANPWQRAAGLPSSIRTVADARRFFRHLLEVERLSFHPDDRFSTYVEMGTGRRSYTPAQAAARDRLMRQVFAVVPDPYDLALKETRRFNRRR